MMESLWYTILFVTGSAKSNKQVMMTRREMPMWTPVCVSQTYILVILSTTDGKLELTHHDRLLLM